MAGLIGNQNRITLACFLAYFVMSGMLAPIGIISGPMSELFDRPITDVTAQFSWLTIGNLCGAALALEVEGASASLYLGDDNAPAGGQWPLAYMNSYGMTIAAGTSEVQRNILGERVLGLPKSK